MKQAFRKEFDVIVAGGGASGMTAACFCADKCGGRLRVALIEKNQVLGKKLSATGNGKCNLSNEKMEVSCYNGDTGFAGQILKEYPVERILSWFEETGILTVSKNGYLYPMSEQARSVSEALERELISRKVSIFKGFSIVDISKENDSYVVECMDEQGNTAVFLSKKVVLSLGGPASVHGATFTGLEILKKFGHSITEIKPALCALTCEDKILKKLAGVRLQAAVTLETSGKNFSEKGEIIFNDGSVSGIPVLNLSRFMPAGKQNNAGKLVLDLLPEINTKDLAAFLVKLSKHDPSITLEQLFRGLLNYKAVFYILEKNGLNAEKNAGGLSIQEAEKLALVFKYFTLQVTGTKGFESAQTNAGGALTSEFDPETLESLKSKGLFVTGELLDVDGICGGYNLHFAFATGMKAGCGAGEV